MDQEHIRKLIDGLEDFRTRSECIRELTRAGDSALEPLVAAVDAAYSEGARWAAIKCLGSIGARQAIPALAPLLKERNMAGEAREALARIHGKDLGPSPDPWLKLTDSGPESAGKQGAGNQEMRRTGLDEKRLLELVFERGKVACRKVSEGRYSAEIPTGDAGSQTVRIHFDEKDHEGEPIVIVYTRCGRAVPQHYETALRRNLKMPYGALAVAGAGADAQFVMFNTLLRQDMSAAELRKSIFSVAERAGQVRKELTRHGNE